MGPHGKVIISFPTMAADVSVLPNYIKYSI